MLQMQLLEALKTACLPNELQLCAVNGTKKPYHPDQKFLANGKHDPTTPDWKTPLPRNRIEQEVRKGKCLAVGVLTGKVSTGIVAIDHDGVSCDPLIEKFSGLSVSEALPKTIGFTSGKPGRYQLLYQVPEHFWPYLESKVITAGVKDAAGKDEQLDFRWDARQSVIIGQHPETGSYCWLSGQSPAEMRVASCPFWIIWQMLSFRSLLPKNRRDWRDRDWALEYLSHIPNQDLDWYQWRDILLALHYSEVEEEIAYTWSTTSSKHSDKGFDDVWKHIDDNCNNPITVATLCELAKQNGWTGRSPYSELSDRSRSLLENKAELKLEVDDLLHLEIREVPHAQLLPSQIAEPLLKLAGHMRLPFEGYLAFLLPTAASQLKMGNQLLLDASTDFKAKPILWMGNVGGTGVAKSTITRAIALPLNQLQQESEHEYQQQLFDYECDIQAWDATSKEERGTKPKPPVPEEHYLSDYTIEALGLVLAQQPDRGLLVKIEELARFFTSMDSYRNGKGGDRQHWLDFYDGSELKVNRKSCGRIYVPQTAISVLGNIQPDVLKRLINEDRLPEDGLWQRFAWTRIPLEISEGIGSGSYSLDGLLYSLYKLLNQLDAKTYTLGNGCVAIWNTWHQEIGELIKKEPSPTMQAIYPKMKERAARIALILHLIQAVVSKTHPDNSISGATLAQAIAYTRWLIGQTRLIYAEFGWVDNPEAAKILKYVNRFRGCGWISTRMTIHWHSSKEKPTADDARNFMYKVVSLGYAIDNGEVGAKYQILILDSGNAIPNSSKPQSGHNTASVTNSGNTSVTLVTTLASSFRSKESDRDSRYQCYQPITDSGNTHKPSRKDDLDSVVTVLPENQEEISSNDDSNKETEQQLPAKPSDCWRTPNTAEQPILDLVTQVLQGIGLDPTADNAKQVSAQKHFTQADNCLSQSWEGSGSAFMNPPFSKPLPFIQKLIQEYQQGHISEAIALLKAGTLHNKGTGTIIWSSASAICHWGGGKARRIAFLNADGISEYGADFDCVLVYWGAHRERFKEVFQAYGNVSFNDTDSENGIHPLISNTPDNSGSSTGGSNQTFSHQEGSAVGNNPGNNSVGVVTDPRLACTICDDRIEVDLAKLSLDYQSNIPIPNWQPTTNVKPYEQLSRLYLDIETTGLEPDCDRVIAVGFLDDQGCQTILTNADEKVLLTQTKDFLKSHMPEVLIGHNIFEFDLPFLMTRWKKHKLLHPFKTDNRIRTISASSFRGKPLQFKPVRWSGGDIIDTFQQACIWDKSAAKLTSYNLKTCVLALGLRDAKRLELSSEAIKQCWESGDIQTIQDYLSYDLEDTQLLANFLLPVVWYQQQWVPGLSFQDLAIASPALKAERIHERLGLGALPKADNPLEYEGALIDCVAPGLHKGTAKIDVSSLYPSIMLQYGICSRKDPDHKFLGVMQYMTRERLRLKKLAKLGDNQANHQQNGLKILINGSYGFLGTGGYPFNDFQAAALVTAYGRKILKLMQKSVEACQAVVIELDTDGIIFSHPELERVIEPVQNALPDGIHIELEYSNCGIYIPKAKSYVIVHPDGETTVKGLFRKRDRYPLENLFPVEFLRRYFLESPESAQAYYQQTKESLINREVLIEQLTVTRKIRTGEKHLVGLGLGRTGEIVSFYYTQQKRFHKKSGRGLSSVAVESTSGDYWIDWYLSRLEEQYREIAGSHQQPKAEQLPLLLS